MKNIAGLMKQASQMQKKMEDMQAALEATIIEGVSGAGLVSVTLSGKGELKSVRIDPKLADPAETEMLQDLLVAAHADAKRKIDAHAAEEMQKVTGGLNLPAGMKLPF
jgi:DNA-binding YbaB/EbfC family protein